MPVSYGGSYPWHPLPRPPLPTHGGPSPRATGMTSNTHQPQEVEGKDDLQRGRPDHVNVRGQVHEPLGVHGHEVDDLPDRGGLSGRIGDHQGLRDEEEGKRVGAAGDSQGPCPGPCGGRRQHTSGEVTAFSSPGGSSAFPARVSRHQGPSLIDSTHCLPPS